MIKLNLRDPALEGDFLECFGFVLRSPAEQQAAVTQQLGNLFNVAKGVLGRRLQNAHLIGAAHEEAQGAPEKAAFDAYHRAVAVAVKAGFKVPKAN